MSNRQQELERLTALTVVKSTKGLMVQARPLLCRAVENLPTEYLCSGSGEVSQYDRDEALREIEQTLGKLHLLQRLTAFEIGRLYCAAKALLPHGEFDAWVDKIGLYKKTAVAAYMNVYRECLGCPEIAEMMPPTQLQTICQPNFSKDLRAEIFSQFGRDSLPGDITTAQLKALGHRVDAGELTIDSPEVQNLFAGITSLNVQNRAKEIIEDLCKIIEARARHTIVQLEYLGLEGNDESRQLITRWCLSLEQLETFAVRGTLLEEMEKIRESDISENRTFDGTDDEEEEHDVEDKPAVRLKVSAALND